MGFCGQMSFVTAIFIMTVSSVVLVVDVSVHASDVSVKVAVFPVGWFLSWSSKKMREA